MLFKYEILNINLFVIIYEFILYYELYYEFIYKQKQIFLKESNGKDGSASLTAYFFLNSDFYVI